MVLRVVTGLVAKKWPSTTRAVFCLWELLLGVTCSIERLEHSIGERFAVGMYHSHDARRTHIPAAERDSKLDTYQVQ